MLPPATCPHCKNPGIHHQSKPMIIEVGVCEYCGKRSRPSLRWPFAVVLALYLALVMGIFLRTFMATESWLISLGVMAVFLVPAFLGTRWDWKENRWVPAASEGESDLNGS